MVETNQVVETVVGVVVEKYLKCTPNINQRSEKLVGSQSMVGFCRAEPRSAKSDAEG